VDLILGLLLIVEADPVVYFVQIVRHSFVKDKSNTKLQPDQPQLLIEGLKSNPLTKKLTFQIRLSTVT
jgi:hypothetical protein